MAGRGGRLLRVVVAAAAGSSSGGAPVTRPRPRGAPVDAGDATRDARWSVRAWPRDRRARRTASQGLELRYPFCNHRIIQLAFSTPERLRSRGRVAEAHPSPRARGLLPELGLRREDKADFMVMFRRQLDPMIDQICGRASFLAGSIGSRPERRTRSATRTAIPRRPGDASGGCGRSSAVMPSCKHGQTLRPAPFEARPRECYSFLGGAGYERRIGAETRQRQKAHLQEARL